MEREYINTTEIAELLGISRQSIYNMRKAGNLPPSYLIGDHTTRWNRREFEAWMETRRTDAPVS